MEILSEGQDEAYAQLRDVIRDLMDENTTLRGLLRDVAGFVGTSSPTHLISPCSYGLQAKALEAV